MDKKDLIKSPAFLIIVVGIVILILYFIMSPYQNCKRIESGNSGYARCLSKTSW